jgi:hypothetical protein
VTIPTVPKGTVGAARAVRAPEGPLVAFFEGQAWEDADLLWSDQGAHPGADLRCAALDT